MVQYAVFLLVVGHALLTLLALGPGVAALTQALVGLHAHSSVVAGWFALGYGRREKRKTERAEVKSEKMVFCFIQKLSYKRSFF